MTQTPNSRRQRVKQALQRTLDRSNIGAKATALAARTLHASAPLTVAMAERLGDMVDATSSRVLATDEAAAQLAYFVESIAADVPRERVLAAVLEHNLLLDGTVLKLIRPLLRADSTTPFDADLGAHLDPADLDRGRSTLITLLETLVHLRDDAPVERMVDPDLDPVSRLHGLATLAPDLPLDALYPLLSGDRPPQDVARFVMTSYSLFLQTFLLRSTMRLVPQVVNNRLLET